MRPPSVWTSDVPVSKASTASNAGDSRHAENAPSDTAYRPPAELNMTIRASRSACGKGTGRSTSASTIVNIAVVRPIASASMPPAAGAVAGRERGRRTA
jgi:hypothetical protein